MAKRLPTTAAIRKLWDPPCASERIVSLELHSGASVAIDRDAAEAFRALDAVMKASRYEPKPEETWGYACRKIAGSTIHSLHSYGIAVDINAHSNPMSSTLETDMPETMTSAATQIRTTGGATVFRWGGEFKTRPDPMHFEIACGPDELAKGIDWQHLASLVGVDEGKLRPKADRKRLGTARRMAYRRPSVRRLQIYPYDPMLGRSRQNRITIEVPYEDLEPGPRGQLISVIDYDASSGRTYQPVDLNDGSLLASDGLAPSVDDPRFHQQMVYAVCMKVAENIERTIGRRFTFRGGRKLQVLPHAFEGRNAFFDPQTTSLSFGYFRADPDNPGRNMPGQLVFTSLSHDVIAHEMTHAVINRFRPYFNEATNADVFAFHEAIADIVAIFQHFTFPGVLRRSIQDCQSDLEKSGPLVSLAQQFGHATGSGEALRSEGDGKPAPDRSRYAKLYEPHSRGSVLVSAVFDAFFATYQGRIADLLRIATGGTGVLPRGSIHPDLVDRVTVEAADTAQMVLTACIRSFEYLPPIDVTFGDFLRAFVTADTKANPGDPYGLRAHIVEAFIAHGIYPEGVVSLAPESLEWPVVGEGMGSLGADLVNARLESEARMWDSSSPELESTDGARAAQALHRFAKANRELLRLSPEDIPIAVRGFHSLSRIGPDGLPRRELVAQFVQTDRSDDDPTMGGLPKRSGTTVIFSVEGHPIHIIPKPMPGAGYDIEDRAKARVERTRDFVARSDRNDPVYPWVDQKYMADRMRQRFRFSMVHRAIPTQEVV